MTKYKRFTHKILSLFLLVSLFSLFIKPVLAQNGECPPLSSQRDLPAGWWPGTGKACISQNSGGFAISNDPEFPCDSAFRIQHLVGSVTIDRLYYVPPASLTFPEVYGTVKFYFNATDILGYPIIDDFEVVITWYGADHDVLYRAGVNTALVHQVAGDPHYYYEIEQTGFMEQGGYITIEPKEINWPLFIVNTWYVTSFRMVPWSVDGTNIPAMCNIPGQPTPTPTPTPINSPTPTPTVSPTPTGSPSPTGTLTPTMTPTSPTNTPRPSPTQPPYPTSPHGTPGTPNPQSTAVGVSTVAPRGTPTRLPIVNMPTIGLGAVSYPTVSSFGTPEPFGDIAITPNGTSAAQATSISGWGADGFAMVTRWYTSTGFASGSFSTTVTSTTGISSAADIADTVVASVAAPFYYAKLIKLYVPNLWPLVLFLILAVAWVFFHLVVKAGMSIIPTLVDWIRRLMELIPFLE